MPRKPIELPPEVAKTFVRDMRAFHAAKDSLKKHEIAARQLWRLKQHWNGKLRITGDVPADARSGLIATQRAVALPRSCLRCDDRLALTSA